MHVLHIDTTARETMTDITPRLEELVRAENSALRAAAPQRPALWDASDAGADREQTQGGSAHPQNAHERG